MEPSIAFIVLRKPIGQIATPYTVGAAVSISAGMQFADGKPAEADGSRILYAAIL